MLPTRGGTHARAPLLPKLRGEIAEFLDEGSLAHLGALAPTHQCRFSVRAPRCSTTGFSGPLRPVRIARTEVHASAAPFSVLADGHGAATHPVQLARAECRSGSWSLHHNGAGPEY